LDYKKSIIFNQSLVPAHSEGSWILSCVARMGWLNRMTQFKEKAGQDKEKANRVARKLRSGMVDINGAGLAVDSPFGGFKHSGIGREAGKEGLLEFLEVKSVGGWAN